MTNGWLLRINGRPGCNLMDKRCYAPDVSASDFRVYCPGALFGFFQPIIRMFSIGSGSAMLHRLISFI